jgi:hypothetical protein
MDGADAAAAAAAAPAPPPAAAALDGPVGSINHILRGVLADVLATADGSLEEAARVGGEAVREEGRQVSSAGRALHAC